MGSRVDLGHPPAPPRVDMALDQGTGLRHSSLGFVNNHVSVLLHVDDPGLPDGAAVGLLAASPRVEDGLVEDYVASLEDLEDLGLEVERSVVFVVERLRRSELGSIELLLRLLHATGDVPRLHLFIEVFGLVDDGPGLRELLRGNPVRIVEPDELVGGDRLACQRQR